jgi:hypothetical protein
MLATGAVLFEREDCLPHRFEFDDKSRWLLGPAGEKQFEALQTGRKAYEEPKRAFKDGGYYIVSHNAGMADEIKAVMDIGPLGYLSIAAHGHADALAFTLSVAGEEVLIDPGTYAYHTQKKWRNYFRGTSAHNTIRVDGVDQSVIGGNFMWMTNATARCLTHVSEEGRERICGDHDGYGRLSDPVTHKRELLLEKTKKILKVIDTLECGGKHSVEQFWHFPETGQVELGDHDVVFRQGAVKVTLELDGKFQEIQCIKGDEALPLGWVSRRFDVKTPAPTVVCRADIQTAAQFITSVAIEVVAQ